MTKTTQWAANELNRLARRSKTMWERANNEGSGRPEHYADLSRKAQEARDAHDALAARNGFDVEWPGLFPRYTKRSNG